MATAPAVPLFPGIPGGAELVVLLLIFLLMVAPLVIVAGLVVAGVSVFGGDDDGRASETDREETP
jgi:hypothetical protein